MCLDASGVIGHIEGMKMVLSISYHLMLGVEVALCPLRASIIS